MNEMKYRSMMIDGIDVLLIKWQSDEEYPAIRMMCYVNGLYAESTIGFDDFERRDNCYNNLAREAAQDFVALANSASGEEE